MDDLIARIEHELDQVVDPCSVSIGKPVGLVSMGLIKDLALEERADGIHVRIRLRLTSPCCLMAPSFTTQAEARLNALPDIAGIEVSVDPAIDWTPSMMRESYRASLASPGFMRGIESL